MLLMVALTLAPLTMQAQQQSLFYRPEPSIPAGLAAGETNFTFTVGQTIYLQFDYVGGKFLNITTDPVQISSGSLPSGISFLGTDNGRMKVFIGGTCTGATTGAIPATITAVDENNTETTSRTIYITVNKGTPSISGSNAFSGTVGNFGQQTATAESMARWHGCSTFYVNNSTSAWNPDDNTIELSFAMVPNDAKVAGINGLIYYRTKPVYTTGENDGQELTGEADAAYEAHVESIYSGSVQARAINKDGNVLYTVTNGKLNMI
jgi:hypothetical protein